MSFHARAGRALALLPVYAAGTLVLPLVHNAWHDRPHRHGALAPHVHEAAAPAHPAPSSAKSSPVSHGHRRTLAHARPTAPVPSQEPPPAAPPASDPRHGADAPEHYQTSIVPGMAALPAPVLGLARETPPAFDTSVFAASFTETRARPRAPPAPHA